MNMPPFPLVLLEVNETVMLVPEAMNWIGPDGVHCWLDAFELPCVTEIGAIALALLTVSKTLIVARAGTVAPVPKLFA
jgi:hypothetical protein